MCGGVVELVHGGNGRVGSSRIRGAELGANGPEGCSYVGGLGGGRGRPDGLGARHVGGRLEIGIGHRLTGLGLVSSGYGLGGGSSPAGCWRRDGRSVVRGLFGGQPRRCRSFPRHLRSRSSGCRVIGHGVLGRRAGMRRLQYRLGGLTAKSPRLVDCPLVDLGIRGGGICRGFDRGRPCRSVGCRFGCGRRNRASVRGGRIASMGVGGGAGRRGSVGARFAIRRHRPVRLGSLGRSSPSVGWQAVGAGRAADVSEAPSVYRAVGGVRAVR